MGDYFTLTDAQHARHFFFSLQNYELSTGYVKGETVICLHSLLVRLKCEIGYYRRTTATASLGAAMKKHTDSGIVLEWLAASPASRSR